MCLLSPCFLLLLRVHKDGWVTPRFMRHPRSPSAVLSRKAALSSMKSDWWLSFHSYRCNAGFLHSHRSLTNAFIWTWETKKFTNILDQWQKCWHAGTYVLLVYLQALVEQQSRLPKFLCVIGTNRFWWIITLLNKLWNVW